MGGAWYGALLSDSLVVAVIDRGPASQCVWLRVGRLSGGGRLTPWRCSAEFLYQLTGLLGLAVVKVFPFTRIFLASDFHLCRRVCFFEPEDKVCAVFSGVCVYV